MGVIIFILALVLTVSVLVHRMQLKHVKSLEEMHMRLVHENADLRSEVLRSANKASAAEERRDIFERIVMDHPRVLRAKNLKRGKDKFDCKTCWRTRKGLGEHCSQFYCQGFGWICTTDLSGKP